MNWTHIQSFVIFSKCSILLRATVDPEPTPVTQGTRHEYTLDGTAVHCSIAQRAHTHLHLGDEKETLELDGNPCRER